MHILNRVYVNFGAAIAFLALSFYFSFGLTPSAYAVDPNAPQGQLKSQYTWICKRSGYKLTVTNYYHASPSVTFQGLSEMEVPTTDITSFMPIRTYLNEQSTQHTAIYAPNQHKICDPVNGAFIQNGDQYYMLKKRIGHPWSGARISYRADAVGELPTVFEDAASVLNYYRASLMRHGNGEQLPSGCLDKTCVEVALHYDRPVASDGWYRASMVYIAMNHPELSGQDIFNYVRGTPWGSNEADLVGLTPAWINVLSNLHIINAEAIKQQILNRNQPVPDANGGTFIFKKIETPYINMTLMPVENEEEHLIIMPKNTHGATQSGCASWPTCAAAPGKGVIQHHIGPDFAGPPPPVCSEDVPGSAAYVPRYLADSNVMAELIADVEYLTEAQINRINHDKGWNIGKLKSDWTEEMWQNSVPENPNRRRLTYDCVKPRTRSNTRIAHVNADINTGVMNCKTKDIAYYDALINRMFVVNPKIGAIRNHPCEIKKRNAMFKALKNSKNLEKSIVKMKPAVVQ